MPAYELTPRDRAERAAARVLARLSDKTARRLAGPPIVVDGLTLDPHIQLVLKALERTGHSSWSRHGAEVARREVRRAALINALPIPRVGMVEDLTVPGPAGPLAARRYVPPGLVGANSQPGLVFFHGGGFVFGDLDTHDELCRMLCWHARVTVIAVSYRLAPEAPFPAAVEDATVAFAWVHGNAAELGLDPERIAVGGDSAGGNLSAVVCTGAKRGGSALPAFQLLLYPKVSDDDDTASMRLFANGFFLVDEDMEWFLNAYAPVEADPRCYPALADRSGLPPAYVVTAGFDPLRDEGEAYGEALAAAGVPTVVRRHETMIHGFANMTAVSRVARDAVVEMAGALEMGLAPKVAAADQALHL